MRNAQYLNQFKKICGLYFLQEYNRVKPECSLYIKSNSGFIVVKTKININAGKIYPQNQKHLC
jgi:hypothetical protein